MPGMPMETLQNEVAPRERGTRQQTVRPMRRLPEAQACLRLAAARAAAELGTTPLP
jgi:hypothetical protein